MKKNLLHRTIITALAAMTALAGTTAPLAMADDESARKLMWDAYNADDGSFSGQEAAFVHYWNAYCEADSAALRSDIETRLANLDTRYRQHIRERRVPFLDVPHSSMRDFYSKYAAYKVPRGMRLYGESLLDGGDTQTGMDYITKAAQNNDGRAAFILAEAYGYGSYGMPQNTQTALMWLNSSMANGYAPAYELMAEITWDGTWGAPQSQRDAIWYMGEAINKYSYNLDDQELDSVFQVYIGVLRETHKAMVTLADTNLSALGDRLTALKGIRLSYNALRINNYTTTHPNGLRARLRRIQAEMKHYGGTYKIYGLADVDLDFINIQYLQTPPRPNLLGRAIWNTWDNTFKARIEIYPHSSPHFSNDDFYNACQQIWNAMRLDDTLAHELAHVYFCSRYPEIGSLDTYEANVASEGHSTNVAYELIRYTYYGGNLSPETYASRFLSDKYKNYFRDFRRTYLDANGKVIWSKLDALEERLSGKSSYSAHTRWQDTSKERAAGPSGLNNRGFHCDF